MILEFAYPITFLTVALMYYRLFIYDKWEAANSKIAKLELNSLPWIPYEERKTAIFTAVK